MKAVRGKNAREGIIRAHDRQGTHALHKGNGSRAHIYWERPVQSGAEVAEGDGQRAERAAGIKAVRCKKAREAEYQASRW